MADGAKRSSAHVRNGGVGLHERIVGSRAKNADRPEVERAQAPSPADRRSAPQAASDPFAALKGKVHKAVIGKLGPQLATETPDLAGRVTASVEEQLALQQTPLTKEERRRIVGELIDDILGYGPLEPLLRDESVSEVMVNGFDYVYVEQGGKIRRADARFLDDAQLTRIIDKIVSQVGRRIDEASPMVDARLPDGSRVNAIIPPLALDGPTLTIRKFSRDPLTMQDLIGFGTLSPKAAEFLAACVKGALNVLIAGGTGSGKTTMLNATSAFIPGDERIVTIEDAAELQLQQEHVIRLESRPPNIEGKGEIRIRELVRNALRMRPDRIIVGEVRGPETLDMLQAMNTGHEGSLTTIHANSPRDAVSRLETLVLMAGLDLPLRSIRDQVASAFDLIVQVARLVDGSRCVTHVTEVVGMESDVVSLQDIFVARPAGEGLGSLLRPLEPTGLQPHFLEKLAANGVTLPTSFFLEEPPTRRGLVGAATGPRR